MHSNKDRIDFLCSCVICCNLCIFSEGSIILRQHDMTEILPILNTTPIKLLDHDSRYQFEIWIKYSFPQSYNGDTQYPGTRSSDVQILVKSI